MYSRTYKTLVAVPPLLWVGVFLLLPYALMFAHSFWLVRDGFLVHQWNLQNYRSLFANPLYFQVFLRTARIAASVTLCSLLLGYPLAYYLSFHAGPRKELLYQLVIVPLWVSYLVRGYAWKTILGSEGVLNGFLQYLHITHEPVSFFLYSPFAVVLMLGDFLAPLLGGGPSATMIANIVQSLFGSAYDWPLGAAISVGILLVTVFLVFTTERLEKRWSFK